jgi:threonine dehydrogenase-like Zn-dependent dehydrogenase
MKALVWEAPNVMNMREQAVPVPADDEVLLKVAYAGICGSELSGYLGHNALRKPPLVMGHEFSGTVSILGSGATRINPALHTGLKVTVNPFSSSGNDELIQRGLNQLSPSRQLLGAHRPGAYADYVLAPAQSVFPLPENVSLKQGALTEPLACAIRIAELSGEVKRHACLIIGAGPIGLLTMQVLQLRGAQRILIADLDPHRLAMAKELGGEIINPKNVQTPKAVLEATHGRGVPLSVDAVGTALTRAQCIAATMPTGTVILEGLHEEVSNDFPAGVVIRKELVLRGSLAYTPANFAAALTLLEQNTIRLEPWIIEAPLEEGAMWFERLLEAPGNVSKVMLVP